MSAELRPVESADDVLASLNNFNSEASDNPERSRSILRQTQYWVYHPDTGLFGPGKFVGYQNMTFELYEQGNQGNTTGSIFDGHFSRNAIQTALGESFEANSEFNEPLSDWGTALLGTDAFGGAAQDKWKFVVLDVTTEEDEEGDDDTQQKKPRNPPWQRDELILALDLYVKYEGKPPSHTHSDIVELSKILNALPIHANKGNAVTFRNENGVYLKLMNFRRFDPKQQGVGMTRGNKLEKEVWDEFAGQPEGLHNIAAGIRTGYLTVQEVGEEPDEEAFPEGKILFRMHRRRERNRKVIEQAKAKAKKDHGKLCCCACSFDFAAVYGKLGEDFIEGHHTKPLAYIAGETETKVSDIALVCSNCHRMLHRKRPWLTIEALASILLNVESPSNHLEEKDAS